MGRIIHRCYCDKCNGAIITPNNENDVKFNELKRVFCERCYQDLMSLFERWEQEHN